MSNAVFSAFVIKTKSSEIKLLNFIPEGVLTLCLKGVLRLLIGK